MPDKNCCERDDYVDRTSLTLGVTRIGVDILIPESQPIRINEGDVVEDLVFIEPGSGMSTITGRLRNVCGSSRYQNFNAVNYDPCGPQLNNYNLPLCLLIDTSKTNVAEYQLIPITRICGIGSVHQ